MVRGAGEPCRRDGREDTRSNLRAWPYVLARDRLAAGAFLAPPRAAAGAFLELAALPALLVALFDTCLLPLPALAPERALVRAALRAEVRAEERVDATGTDFLVFCAFLAPPRAAARCLVVAIS